MKFMSIKVQMFQNLDTKKLNKNRKYKIEDEEIKLEYITCI